MEQHTIDAFEQLFEALVRHEMNNSNAVCLGVPTTSEGWEFPLPEKLGEVDFMSLVLREWSKEESYCTDEGVWIVTAFGEQENSKMFYWSDIKGIFLLDGVPLMVKPYDKVVTNIELPLPNLTMKDVMHNSEGVKKSMGIMRKLNPKK